MERVIEIPVWKKYTLSIEEAAAYFRIGENKLRRLVAEEPGGGVCPVEWNTGPDQAEEI